MAFISIKPNDFTMKQKKDFIQRIGGQDANSSAEQVAFCEMEYFN